MSQNQGYPDFDEYIRQGEPSKREAAYAWSTAIGLQAVDGLKTSEYLNDLARRNIEGEITIEEVGKLLDSYYESKTVREPDDDDKEEADKASKNIKKILSTVTLNFTTNGLINIHRRIFEGVFKHAGELRKYDITKREWVLEGDTVRYLNWEDLRRALDYDIKQEKEYSYHGVATEDVVKHLTGFVSGLWQIHPFGEGNTRTTAVFTILYLRSIGFNVENDLFAKNSWYFRNALVRANYKSAQNGIDYTPVYLERFFRNLLLGEKWELRNRYLHIHAPKEWSVQPNLADPTSTRTSTRTSSIVTRLNPNSKFYTDNEIVIELVRSNPNHPRQKYLLTVKGLALYNELKNLEN
jgi:fido (protein-threonine AMPylation protein)